MSHQASAGFTRRAFLRGMGACLALPTLESFRPIVKAAGAAQTAATTASGLPLRMGFIAFANGSNYQRWLPKGEGREYELNETFVPMTKFKDKFQIITSLAHDTANNWGDGPRGTPTVDGDRVWAHRFCPDAMPGKL